MPSARAWCSRAVTSFALLPLFLAACEGSPGPVGPDSEPAGAHAGGGGGPTVKSTDPVSSPRNATLDVRVLGSGFKADAEATWALKGDTSYATTRIRTNSTRFVSSTELIANITISPDAPLELYDVVVTLRTPGKKGIGLELFEVTYEQIDLGFGAGSQAYDVNGAGQIVGWGIGPGGVRALMWENGVVTDLGVLPGMTDAFAFGINELGHVVGSSWRMENGVAFESGFLWTPSGGMVALGTLGGRSSQATAVNDVGDVVGRAMPAGSTVYHATLWRGGVATDLHVGQGESWATDVNNGGVVVGVIDAGLRRSFRWTDSGGLQFLFAPGTRYGDGATGIDALGRIVGFAEPSPGQAPRGYLWTDGVVQTVPTDAESYALAVHAEGGVVGHHLQGIGGGRKSKTVMVYTAYTWGGVGTPSNLMGERRPANAHAYAVNGRGWIVGTADFGPTEARAVLWKLR